MTTEVKVKVMITTMEGELLNQFMVRPAEWQPKQHELVHKRPLDVNALSTIIEDTLGHHMEVADLG